jgi:hypothetical protein
MSEIFSLNSSKSKSKAKSRNSELRIIDSDSEGALKEVEISDLHIIANPEKIQEKQASRVSSIYSKSSKKSSINVSSIKINTPRRTKKNIIEENNTDSMRRELLFKYNKINQNGKWSSLKLSMDDSHYDIRNEYERVCKEIQMHTSVKFYKDALLMGIRGVEMLNSNFDPLGIDLEGWSQSMSFSIDTQNYEEVLTDLAEKYKSIGNVSPEIKLMGLIFMSGFTFTAAKKMEKMMSSMNQPKSKSRGPRGPRQVPRYNNDNDTDTDNESGSSAKIPEPIDIDINEDEIDHMINLMQSKKNEVAQETLDKVINIKAIPKKRGRPAVIKKTG